MCKLEENDAYTAAYKNKNKAFCFLFKYFQHAVGMNQGLDVANCLIAYTLRFHERMQKHLESHIRCTIYMSPVQKWLVMDYIKEGSQHVQYLWANR